VLITDDYRALNEEMHNGGKRFGQGGERYAGIIRELAVELKTEDILDYGCGKGDFALHFPYPIKQYDPCVPKFSAPPEPADIVVCTDVLEHVEPDCLDDVLGDLKRVTKHYLVTAIALYPAKKTLPDGRNTHLIVESMEWWKDKFLTYLDLDNEELLSSGHVALLAFRSECPYKYAE
jgi:Methyltransferase domain